MRSPDQMNVPRIVAACAGMAVLAGLLLSWSAEAAPCPREKPAYMGSKSCRNCHFKEYKTWGATKMARAFESLKPGQATEAKKKHGLDPAKDYTRDASCLPCHTTGYGENGGYPEVVEGKAWTAAEAERAKLHQGVGCESCHGPGEKTTPFKKDNKMYAWKDLASRGAFHPVKETCTACHSGKSPTARPFDFEKEYAADNHDIFKLKADHGCDHPHRGGK